MCPDSARNGVGVGCKGRCALGVRVMNTKISKQLRSFRNSSALTGPMAALGAMSVLFGSGAAHAGGLNPDTLPTGANVVGGKATIAQSGNTLDVNQSTNRTVIDWRSFDIGSNATTNFHQPDSSSIAVNRVNSSANPTDIEGHLNANGQVWILNPNGVFFGKTARVDAAGIVASTANIDASRFMAGDTRLQMTGADHGSVVNQGSITVGQSGLAAFVAPSVRNSGTITATVGKVTLAAGTTYTLDLAGDQLVEIGLGAGKALVDQSGKIVDAGGRVTLTAKAASQVVDSVVNVSGVVDASSAHMDGGTVVLGGDDVTTTSTAQIKADGGTAGAGNGGTITAVADNTGNYAGSFSAKGGTTAGDGGKVETSGHDVTVAAGTTINTTAANGKAGTWLLDPVDLTVDSSLASTIETNLSNGNVIGIGHEFGYRQCRHRYLGPVELQHADLWTRRPSILMRRSRLPRPKRWPARATTVNVAATGLIQNGVDVALDGGATVNVAAGTYSDPAVSITKSGISLVGATGAKITVSTATTNGIDIWANNDSISGFEITGPAEGTSYLTFAWGGDITRGIAVHNGATNFSITGNNIHGLRNDILIDGRNTGSVTGNTIDNSKSGISIQYTDAGAGNTEGYTVDISGNTEGTFGNEWGMNVHLNGHYDDATTSTGYHGNGDKIAADAPPSVQTALLAASSANGGWRVQDQGYSNSNRTAVTVDPRARIPTRAARSAPWPRLRQA